MVKLSFLFMIVCISLVAGACNKSPSDAQTGSSIADSSFKELALEIPTITCPGCRFRVEASARSVSGVIGVRFDRKSAQRVIIIYDSARTNSSLIIKSIEKKGDKVIELPQ